MQIWKVKLIKVTFGREDRNVCLVRERIASPTAYLNFCTICTFRGCLVFFFFSSLIIPYSFFVTPHSSLKIPQIPKSYPFGNCFHFTSLKYFNLFVGLIPKLSVRPFCYFNIVPLPFTPSTKCLSHHSLPLLLVLKKSKLKKLK